MLVMDQVNAAFRAVDVAGSGVIEDDELLEALAARGASESEIAETFARLRVANCIDGHGHITAHAWRMGFGVESLRVAPTLATTKLPAHLRLGITLPGMLDLYEALPRDAVDRANKSIPPLYREELEGCHDANGATHRDTLISARSLANLLDEENRTEEAAILRDKYWVFLLDVVSEPHPTDPTLVTLSLPS